MNIIMLSIRIFVFNVVLFQWGYHHLIAMDIKEATVIEVAMKEFAEHREHVESMQYDNRVLLWGNWASDLVMGISCNSIAEQVRTKTQRPVLMCHNDQYVRSEESTGEMEYLVHSTYYSTHNNPYNHPCLDKRLAEHSALIIYILNKTALSVVPTINGTTSEQNSQEKHTSELSFIFNQENESAPIIICVSNSIMPKDEKIKEQFLAAFQNGNAKSFVECLYKSHIVLPAHIVYSHAWYENNLRCKYDHETGKWVSDKITYSSIMIFKDKNTIKSSSGKEIVIGDDNTTFYNSYAMKFAFLGESLSMPSYAGKSTSYSSNPWSLYTQKAVCDLADHLRYCVQTEKKERIILVGPCVGASIAIECLKKLVNFTENKAYFETSSIKKQDDAQAIINAINKGAFIAIVPLMSIKKHNAIAVPCAIASGLTLAAAAAVLYAKAGMAQDSMIAQLGVIGAGLLASCTFGGFIKNLYAHIAQYAIVPPLSRCNYNPFHEDPIHNIVSLKGLITCPVFLNFTEKDWVMEWKDEDCRKLYAAFYDASKAIHNVHIMITNDAGHMSISQEFINFLKEVQETRINSRDPMTSDLRDTVQPGLVALKRIIHPNIFSYVLSSKKWVIALAFLCAFPFLLRFIHTK